MKAILKSMVAFCSNRSSANALAVAKLFISFLSPVHRLELIKAVEVVHYAETIADPVLNEIDQAATDANQ